MRVEQKSDNSYVKKPDKVEAYILRIIQRYFETNEEAVSNSREDIITEALRRMRQETVNSVEKIIVSETKKYINEEFDQAVEERLGSFITELWQELYRIRQSTISKQQYVAEIPNTTSEVSLPSGSNISLARDVIDVYINGILSVDHTFTTDATLDQYIRKVVFPDVLFPGDKVTVKCIIISRLEES